MSESLGRGRSLAQPSFPGDDGSAAAGIDEVLTVVRTGDDAARDAALDSLASMRVVAAVVAVLDEEAPDGSDKSSHMAVVSMINVQGEKGLLAFTSVATLATWNPDARPVPATARTLAQTALDDDAEAVVIDVAGPIRTVIAGPMLHRLAAEA